MLKLARMSDQKLFAGLAQLAKFQEEVEGEKASALARVADGLTRCLFELTVLHQKLATDEIDALQAAREFNALRERAFELRWFLEVQRDALGLHHHEDLYRAYPIPDPIPIPDDGAE